MFSVIDIACYFLCLPDENAGDLISNLKLQKLLYYAQGFHLALYTSKLFQEDIRAWEHGPVVPDAYHEFKEFGSSAIPAPEVMDFGIFDPETEELLDEVYAVYGQFSAWKLRNMTHEESPWKDTSINEVISPKKMRDYFKTQLASE
ncbi:Panacea domain-containing protein [Leptothoe kymatousa]|uniref:SocA family protein n=1 Tax=Leptothoe kymatousa TAU-MAC 1615 TaxID=2364775 RepID=A0ABS5Y2V0_9CYAN|nr:type II toxin-antitoxin system antitoxin SocA domain-containing protein [Leptothoe kymatousa]MBT9312155.1 SocA family protein [Leptothoe kymatousa TAU-MAC 1615]